MNDLWIDFKTIIIFSDVSLWQALGWATAGLVIINVLLYAFSCFLMWRTRHDITQRLRDKLLTEILLLTTTFFMGLGALSRADVWLWQLNYLCRVGLLLIMPFILWRLIKACLTIVNVKKE